jgi:hypothetical protein
MIDNLSLVVVVVASEKMRRSVPQQETMDRRPKHLAFLRGFMSWQVGQTM